MRKGLAPGYWVGGAAVLILSFSVTLWLTEPEVPITEKIELLKASSIADETTLNQAARQAGLQNSPDVRGNVDALKRIGDDFVTIAGWATETITIVSKGAPTLVMVFSSGKNVLTMQTQGERPDVTNALHLSPEAAKNGMFSGQFSCNLGAGLIIAAVSVGGTYANLGTHSCP